MSDIRIVDKPRIEVDFPEMNTSEGDLEAGIDAYKKAAEAARSLNWSQYLTSVRRDGLSGWTVILERADQ
jgi:hypothetical protein